MADQALSQDDIDAMLAAMDGGSAEPAPTKPATKPAAKPVEQRLADAERAGGAVAAAADDDSPAVPAPAIAAAAPAAEAGPLSQNEIDQMLAALGGDTAPVTKPATKSFPAAAGSGSGSAKPGIGKSPLELSASGPLGQNDIDQLLADLGISEPAVVETAAAAGDNPATISPGNAPTMLLSTDALEALVDKHAPGPEQAPSEAMIDQRDIDALVGQLAGATGAANTSDLSAMMAQHDAAIDQLQHGHGANPNLTVDAVDAQQVLGASTMAGAGGFPMPHAASAHHAPAPVIAQFDLRGARWLLTAAVLLLAVTATTMLVAVKAISNLAHELRQERVAETATPGDDYGADLKAATAKLNDVDEGEQAKGVLLLNRLKGRQPAHEAEIALVLARHHRERGAWRAAAGEFALVVEDGKPQSDPRLYADYADCLSRSNEPDAAVRQLYRLLGNEQLYLASTDAQHRPRSATDIDANRTTLRQATLALGRLLGPRAAPLLSARAPRDETGGGHAENAHAEAAPHAPAHGGGHHD